MKTQLFQPGIMKNELLETNKTLLQETMNSIDFLLKMVCYIIYRLTGAMPQPLKSSFYSFIIALSIDL
jgi:hypothetical protein